MGCGYSKEFNTIYNSPQFVAWNQSFQALKISKEEVSKLFKLFQKADMDGGGTIDVVELLTVMDVERTPFTERVFSIFDDDKSGKIDFYEFVLALWNYCTLSKVTLGMFAFDLYDRDASGVLEEKDVDLMMRDIYGKEANTSHYARQVKRDIGEFMAGGGEITLNRFLEFAKHHHSLLFPAFQMQLYLKKNLLGVNFWERCADRRIKLSKKKFVTVKQLIEMHALASVEHLKHVKVNTTSGKLAIHSIGHHAHRRKKYTSSQDPDDPEAGSANDRAVYPAETFGEVLDNYPRESAKLKSKIKPSNANNTQSEDLLDNILQKSNSQPYNSGLNASNAGPSPSGKGAPSFAAAATVVAGTVSTKRRASVSAQSQNNSSDSANVATPAASGNVSSPATKTADLYSLGPTNEYNGYSYSSKNTANTSAGGSNGSVTSNTRLKDRRKSL